MKTHKKSQKFHVWIHSKNLEIAFGILYQLGIDTLEEKKTQQGIRLTGEIPKKYSVLQWKKHLISSQPKKNFFKKIELESSSDQKWATEYLKYLQPIHLKTNHPILSSLVIDPRGEKPLKKSSNTLYLDPSLAFGTGAHPTTALCAELLCSQFDPKKKSLLDVGTGSGILAMIGNKIGFNPVVGIDNDPIAIEVAEQNQKRNGLKGMLFQDHFRTLRKFDLIVANILLPTLIDLKTHFEKHLKANGTLIVSGLLYKDAAPLLKKYSNWVLIERKNKKGWAALLLKKKALRKT